MKFRRLVSRSLLLGMIFSLFIFSSPVYAQESQPPQRPIFHSPTPSLTQFNQIYLAIPQSSVGGITLNWSACDSCPESPEVSISGNTINLGIANRTEQDYQSMSKHGVSAQLPSAGKYTISFDYTLYTWDSYQPSSLNYKGYWDSFSVSVSEQPYWQLSLSDPVKPTNLSGLGFITGGSTWGQGVLQSFKGSKTVVISGNASGSNYLNLILDTATSPEADNAFPSWGSITIKDLRLDSNMTDLASQAAELAKSVVGGPYGWGGKGWDWISKEYVDADTIRTGKNYNYWVTADNKVESRNGLDCAGLIYWSYDKASGSKSYYGDPIYYEGAHQQCSDLESDPITNENDLRPGDILCFNYGTMAGLSYDHVAMYVGGTDPSKDVVQASNGIQYASKSILGNTTTNPAFKGFRRIKPPIAPLVIQTHSPVTLVVTDPDGNTVNPNTLITTNEEYIRGIPDNLYYSVDDNFDDFVYAPILKSGVYTIQVIPKPEALPTDTFSLEVTGATKLVQLAQNVPVSAISDQPFGIISTGDEIVPIQPTTIYNSPPTLSIPDSQTAQYSDILTLDVSASDPDNLDILTFSVTGLPGGLTFTDNGDRTGTVAGIVEAEPGDYPVFFSVTDSGGLSDSKSMIISVEKEDARVTYTGPMLISTASTRISKVAIPLRATIQDITTLPDDSAYDQYPGDITKATISFVNRGDSNKLLCTSTISLIDSDTKTGTASCDWLADIGTNNSLNYTVGIIVDGYYVRDSTYDDTVIDISKPGVNFVSGGGFLISQSSSGKYASDAGSKINFGFMITYIPKRISTNTNLNGQVTLMVHHNGHLYWIKATNLSSLVTDPYYPKKPTSGTAELLSIAAIIDVTNWRKPVTVVTNANLQITMKDNGEPGKKDILSISLWDKSGTLLFSSNWNGAKSQPQTIAGGNLIVR